MARVIVHIDMDAFYTAIEMLDHPELRGHPVIVGGGVTRGVVSAASYEARAFGVHSAMPMAQALHLCPGAIVMHGHMGRYQDVSRRVMAVLAAHCPVIEQVSVDEAYLDMTHWLPAGITPEAFAHMLQAEVFAAVQLTCSIGVASGKAIAKMASDLRKPNGVVVVPPGGEAAFLAPLPIGCLRGVGAATERKLRDLGVTTIGALAALPESFLVARFGVHGRDLRALALGHDDSPVVPARQAKSIGRETTFMTDIGNRETLEGVLLELCDNVGESLRRHHLLARGVTLKYRYGDFHTFTRALALPAATDLTDTLYAAACRLLRDANPNKPCRLIGVTATSLQAVADRQLTLFDADTRKRRQVAEVVDQLRARYGADAITRARLKRDE